MIAELAKQLTTEFGKGWSERQLHYCLRIAEVFSDAKILNTVCAELSWSHLRLIIQIDEPLKRAFYIEICRVEHWSVRQLQERINSLLTKGKLIVPTASPCLLKCNACAPKKSNCNARP